jgi:hypothetical protein
MVYNTRNYWVFGLSLSMVWYSKKTPENTTIKKLDMFPFSGEEWGTATLLGPLVRANCNH